MSLINKDLVIIGGGSAGMAAASAAYDLGVRDILVLERTNFLGGILNQCIHNGFGLNAFKEELTGPEFFYRFESEMEKRGIAYELETNVTSISKDKVITYINRKGCFEVKAKAIIMAAGCYERNAGAIGTPGDRPSGVITAGQAQLYLNEYGYLVGKKVFILGSGDIGLIMARRMTLEGAKVLGVAELCSYSNGLNRNIQQCLIDYDIPLYLSHTVSRIIGKSGHLEAIELSEVDETKRIIPGTGKIIEVDTLLLSIGLIPNNDLLNKMGIPQGRSRGSVVNEHLETSIDGVFSCGNVLHVHDLADYVVDEGKTAGQAAALYLSGKLPRHEDVLLTEAGEGIGYVVPGIVDLANAEDRIAFKFRVRVPSKDVYIQYALDGEVIKRIYKQTIIPSEMEIDYLPKSLFTKNKGKVTVSLVRKGE
jgi:NADPH-dependent 2,4-dienoyl-CoA reductase/sulfur reductase-like enzyme